MNVARDDELLSAGTVQSQERSGASWDNRLSWSTAVGFVAVYVALMFAAYALQVNSASPASIWPSGGLLFAMLMLLRKRDWVWVILLAIPADVAVNWLTPGAVRLDSAIVYACGNTLDGLIGAMLARYWISSVSSPRDAAAFYLAGAIGCVVSTTLSAVVFLSRHPDMNPIVAWLRWWAGNVLGILTVAPIAFTWVARRRTPQRSRAMPPTVQLVALNALLVVVTIIIFGAVPVRSTFDLGLQFAVLPILVLIALRCPSRWTMLSASVMTVLAVALTNRGLGPFSAAAQVFGGVFSLQIFLALTVATTFLLSVSADENRGLLTALTFSRGRYRREAQLLRSEIEHSRSVEQQRADAERENRQLAALVRRSKEFIGIATLDGRVQFINDSGRRMIGLQSDENLGGRTIRDVIHPAHRDKIATEMMPLLGTAAGWSGELDFRRMTDGAAISTLTEAFRIDDAGGSPLCFAAVSRDITELKHAAAARRELEQAYLDEADRQQIRLGREIHDGLGQELTGLSLLVSAVATQAQRGNAASAGELADIVGVVRQSIATARGIARGLSPLTENDGELIKSLRQLVDRVTASSSLSVAFHHRGDEPTTLTQETRNHLYRIAQEALSNALRHSCATRIDVYFEVEGDLIRLKVADNGQGIADVRSEGLGLRTMRYRAMDIGGTLTVYREAQGGTVIQCDIQRAIGEADGSGVRSDGGDRISVLVSGG